MSDELSRARLYLQLDPDEMENIRASQRLYEMRKAAKAYRPDKTDFQKAIERGDMGSPVEPISFVHPECSTCGTWLTHETRSCVVGTCQTCLYNRNAKAEQMRRDAAEEKNRKRAKEARACGLFLIGCVVGLIALAVLAGWAAAVWHG